MRVICNIFSFSECFTQLADGDLVGVAKLTIGKQTRHHWVINVSRVWPYEIGRTVTGCCCCDSKCYTLIGVVVYIVQHFACLVFASLSVCVCVCVCVYVENGARIEVEYSE